MGTEIVCCKSDCGYNQNNRCRANQIILNVNFQCTTTDIPYDTHGNY